MNLRVLHDWLQRGRPPGVETPVCTDETRRRGLDPRRPRRGDPAVANPLFHDGRQRDRLMLLLLVGLFIRPPAAGASNCCFYEMNAPTRQSSGQSLLAGHVDAATGAFLFRLDCNTVTHPGMDLQASIIYNTQDASPGP